MSKHTLGPWGFTKGITVWVMAGPIHVATIPRAADGDWSEANAFLIAAAPDLLEALKAIEDHHNETEEWREIARAAIAKAEVSA